MSDSPIPTGIRIAQLVGITSAAYLSGYIVNFSVAGVPSLARASLSVKPQIWQDMYKIGASTAPFFAIFSSLSFSYLASRVSRAPDLFKQTILDSTKTFYFYLAAAILVPAIVPFTLGIMKPTNDRLHAKADKYRLGASEVKEDRELEDLLKKWTMMNTVRSLFPLAAAVVGLLAVVSVARWRRLCWPDEGIEEPFFESPIVTISGRTALRDGRVDSGVSNPSGFVSKFRSISQIKREIEEQIKTLF